jgi:excisionase family DNA binding protein
MDAEEVAPLLSTTAHTLRRLAREGKCPVLVRRIGGRWRFSRLDVDRFIDGAGDVGEAAS